MDIAPALVVDDAHLARHAAASGAGVALLAAAYLTDALESGALAEVLRPAKALATSTRLPPRRRRTGGSSSDPRP